MSQFTFIFMTQIYYNMNLITSSSNFIARFPCHFEANLCRLLLKENFLGHKKCIFLNMTAKIIIKNWECC